MRFLLQQGHGMLELAPAFVASHSDSGIVLSPRACKPEQLVRLAGRIRQAGGTVLFDPQFYQPRTNHERILAYPYWSNLEFTTSEFDASDFCARVIEYQIEALNLTTVILPGRFTNSGDQAWRDMQAQFAEADCGENIRKYMTVAIGPDFVMNQETFDAVVDEMLVYPVDGFYFLVQNPNNQFMSPNDGHIYALLDAFLSLSKFGKEILVGYSNQQSLVYAAAGVDMISSGNFRNVRSFDPGIFSQQDPVNIQRGVWYYDGYSLGEYHPEQFALPYRRGMQGAFGPSCIDCSALISAANPATIPWGEPLPFRHYLHVLHEQWLAFGQTARGTARADRVAGFFEDARSRGIWLQSEGFALGTRGFTGLVADAPIAALAAFRQDRRADLARL